MNEGAAAVFRKRIEVRGIVQGVGFRPFVYRIAGQCGIRGSVLNSSDGVVIEAEGTSDGLESFLIFLKTELPPLARIEGLMVSDQTPRGDAQFTIEHSVRVAGRFALAPPNVATCADCARDFTTPENRRFGGNPFTNCTNCGPRYTIIRDVPYDRSSTTMEAFPMCARCRAEV